MLCYALKKLTIIELFISRTVIRKPPFAVLTGRLPPPQQQPLLPCQWPIVPTTPTV